MPTFNSQIPPTSDNFQRNRADMLALVDKMRELNLGAPFLEIGNMAGYLCEPECELLVVTASAVSFQRLKP